MAVEKQAFEKGYHEGERMGKQMGEKMVETVVHRYDQTIVELGVAHRKLVESMETETVRLSLDIAKNILGREATVDPDLVSALVTVALKKLQGHHEITLKVGEDDYDRVRTAIENVNSTITVEQEASLDRGDFILDTNKTHLDGRISERVEAIGRTLLDQD